MEQIRTNYWASSSIYSGPLQSSAWDVCSLSVILEAGLQHDISEIRIIIVDPQTESPDWEKMIIRECLNGHAIFPQPSNLSMQAQSRDAEPFKEFDRASAVASYRSALRHRDGRIIRPNPLALHHILQVVLSVAPADSSIGEENGFAEDYDTHFVLQIFDVRINTGDPIHHPIIFDKTFAVDPYNPSIFIMLESSHCFVSTEYWDETDELLDVIGFSFRILPCIASSHGPSKITELPQELLLAIIRETVLPLVPYGENAHNWEGGILSCALVCKSWAYLIQVLYEKIDEGYPVRNFEAFVQSVCSQPTMSKHLQSFSEQTLLRLLKEEYPLFPEQPIYPEIVEGCRSLLRTLPSISNIDIDPRLFGCVSDYLPQLSTVQSFSLNDQPWYGDWTKPMTTFEELYSTIQTWASLKRLQISTRLKLSADETQLHQLIPPTFALEELFLGSGTFSKSQVFHLLSASLGSLTRLKLMWVEGLTNNDLLEILRAVSHTLEILEVPGSTFPTSPNTTHAETKALDCTISQMPKVIRVTNAGSDIATQASLLRKRPCPSHRPYIKSDWSAPCCAIQLGADDRSALWHPHDFDVILRETSWSSITVVIQDTTLDKWYPPEEMDRLKRVALEKGIDLNLFGAITR